MDYYKKIENDKIICNLCHHHCKLKNSQIGFCGVNKNTEGKLETLVYGYPGSMNIDPIEKKPLYHVLPETKTLSFGTVGCNFKCPFCQNWQLSQSKEINKSKYISPKDMVTLAIKNKCDSISYTYNEPTIFYPYIKDIATIAKQNNIKNIFVSNGFESTDMINDMKGLIDAANIDLKSFNEDYYKKELKGNLNKLLENLKLFKKNDIWLEITTLIVPENNDSEEELTKIAKFIKENLSEDTPWHLSAFHPDYKIKDKEITTLESLKRAYNIGKEIGLKNVYIGNMNEVNNTICSNCNHSVIKRQRYQTKENNLVNGTCSNCGEKVEGVFNDKRKMKVSGTFYSNNPRELDNMFKHFNIVLDNTIRDKTFLNNTKPKMIISPHAGFIYSGFTANIVYRMLRNSKPKRIVVIGPSHKVYLENMSISLFNTYSTPLGDLKVGFDFAKKYKEKHNLTFKENFHIDHSTETQMPFIKYYFPDIEVVEVIYRKVKHEKLTNLISELIEEPDTYIVISTDLSHFHDLNKAKQLDNICLEGIKNLDNLTLDNGCEACGKKGVQAAVEVAKNKKLKSQLIDYRTSAHITKDTKRVVGYLSSIFY